MHFLKRNNKSLNLSDYQVKICVFATVYFISFDTSRIHEIKIRNFIKSDHLTLEYDFYMYICTSLLGKADFLIIFSFPIFVLGRATWLICIIM